MKSFFIKIASSLKNWINQKPQTWSNLSETDRQKASAKARAKAEGIDGTPFEDKFGSSAVNPGSSQIGATVNQRGLDAVMSRRIYEPRQIDGDTN